MTDRPRALLFDVQGTATDFLDLADQLGC